MSKYFVSYLVQCPFYKDEEPTVIHCEGIEPGSNLHNVFPSTSTKKAQAYKEHYCQSSWEQCRIAKMLGEPYE